MNLTRESASRRPTTSETGSPPGKQAVVADDKDKTIS